MRPTLLRAIAALVALAPAPALAEGWVDHVAIGALMHDRSPFADRHEDGYDLNFEVAFRRPDWDLWWAILAPYPQVGANLNLYGDTSYAYGGLGWEVDLPERFFVGGAVGLAVHNGPLTKTPAECANDDCGFGSPFTIRLAGEVGWRLDERNAVSVFMDHISHAGWFAEQNEGVDNIGLRWHRRF